jgi:hypothetical protein
VQHHLARLFAGFAVLGVVPSRSTCDRLYQVVIVDGAEESGHGRPVNGATSLLAGLSSPRDGTVHAPFKDLPPFLRPLRLGFGASDPVLVHTHRIPSTSVCMHRSGC